MFELIDEAKKVAQDIKLINHLNASEGTQDKDALNADVKWGASDFLAKLLLESENYFEERLTLEKIKKICHNAKIENYDIKLDWIIANYWLQEIDEIFFVPKVINSALFSYNSIKDFKQEFEFIIYLKSSVENSNSIAKDEFENCLATFNSESKLKIGIERVFETQFVTFKEGHYTIGNIECYMPLFKEADKLILISKLLEFSITKSHEKYKISNDKLAIIYEVHKNYQNAIPELNSLVEDGLLIKYEDYYQVNFYSSGISYWQTLSAQIGAKLWELLNDRKTFISDKELFRIWIYTLSSINTLNLSLTYLKREDIKRILKVCCELLLNEKILLDKENEIERLIYSGGAIDFTWLSSKTNVCLPKLSEYESQYSLYNAMNNIDEIMQNNLFIDQPDRWLIDSLIQLVVFYDSEFEDNGIGYSTIRKLLKESFERPYLLYSASSYLINFKPQIISFLCLDEEIATHSFQLILELEKPHQMSLGLFNKMKLEIQKNLFSIYLKTIRNADTLDNAQKAKELLWCFTSSSLRKWKSFNSDNSRSNIIVRNILSDRFNAMKRIFISLPSTVKVCNNSVHANQFYFAEILNDLFVEIRNYNEVELYKNSVLGFPLVKIEMLELILGLSKRQECINELERNKTLITEYDIVSEFVSSYSTGMQQKEIVNTNHYWGEPRTDCPYWVMNQNGLNSVKWGEWLLLIEKHNLYNRFYNCIDLNVSFNNSYYSNLSELFVARVRNHINVFILGYEYIVKIVISQTTQNSIYSKTCNRIEQAISDLISQFGNSKNPIHYIDILESKYENNIFYTSETVLLPKIASILNVFSTTTRRNIINSILDTNDISKFLVLLEYITNESELDFIKSKIKEIDIVKYLTELSSKIDIEIILTKMAFHNEFIVETKNALSFFEEKIANAILHNDDYSITLFRAKLMIAYHETNESEICELKEPKLSDFAKSNLKTDLSIIRNYYTGLVKMKLKKYIEAFNLFDHLLKVTKTIYPAIAVNRLAAGIEFAKEEKQSIKKNELILDRLKEWSLFEDNLPKLDKEQILSIVFENLAHTKLEAFHEIANDVEFDILFNSLGTALMHKREFATLRVENLMVRNLFDQAVQFIQEIKEYHTHDKNIVPAFIIELQNKLDVLNNYDILSSYYLRVVTKSPEELVKLLPNNIATIPILEKYVLNEFYESACDLLDYINAIEEIKGEDKYSDLIILCLKSRIKNWYWKIGNSRGAFSDSNKKNVGEQDIVIFDANNSRIATCEALMLYGKNTSSVNKHVVKTFNYDHRRKLFYILIYYMGNDFSNHWTDYVTNIVPNIEYKENFTIYNTIEELEFNNNSIKVGKASHANNLSVYHIFININYKL